MQRRPYKVKGLDAILMCSNKNCDNISSKLFLVEEKIVLALNEWLKDYHIEYNKYLINTINKNMYGIERDVLNLKKELEIQNRKLVNIYNFYEEGTYTKEVFLNRHQLISGVIINLKSKIKELEKKNEEVNRNTNTPKFENLFDLYFKLQTVEQKNSLLKAIVKKVEYLKKEKAVKKNSDFTNFELDIYPNIGRQLIT